MLSPIFKLMNNITLRAGYATDFKLLYSYLRFIERLLIWELELKLKSSSLWMKEIKCYSYILR